MNTNAQRSQVAQAITNNFDAAEFICYMVGGVLVYEEVDALELDMEAI